MTTRDRRKKRFKSQDKHQWRNFLLLLIPLVAASLLAIVGTQGVTRHWTIVISLILIFGCSLIGLERFIWRNTAKKLRFATLAVCTLVAGAGFWLAPLERRWLHFTDAEMQRFVAVLTSQTNNREKVRLACPASNEDICILVTPFVEAFKRGHFIVENDRVERVVLGKPTGGVVLFRYGHADDYDAQDPDQGVWMHITSGLETLESAFAEIGINIKTAADQKLPEDTIGVYFGIESHEPIKRTDFKKLKREATP